MLDYYLDNPEILDLICGKFTGQKLMNSLIFSKNKQIMSDDKNL